MSERYIQISKALEIAAIDQFLHQHGELPVTQKVIAVERHGKDKVVAIVKVSTLII